MGSVMSMSFGACEADNGSIGNQQYALGAGRGPGHLRVCVGWL
jgi:hypothetical protein